MKRWKKILLLACALMFLVVLASVVFLLIFDAPTRFKVGAPLPPGRVVPQVCQGFGTAVLLAPDGSLWAWGRLSPRYVGAARGQPINPNEPMRINPDTDWVQIAGLAPGLLALKADGTLWGWGALPTNHPPRNPPNELVQPICFSHETNWTAIAANSHYMALKNDGSLWGWGQNSYGEVGDGTTNRHYLPVQVGIDQDWKAISPGSANSYALKTNGTLWGWGMDTRIFNKEKAHDLAPRQIDPGTDWTAISAGDFHLLALRSDGTLWIRGQNAMQLANDYARDPVNSLRQLGRDVDWAEIHSGGNCFFARKRDGTWWAGGNNTHGQLGLGPPPGYLNEGWVNAFGRVLFGIDGTVMLQYLTSPLAGSPQRMSVDADAWTLASSQETTYLLTRDGSLWSWGVRLGIHPPPEASKLRAILHNLAARIKRLLPQQSSPPPAKPPAWLFGTGNAKLTATNLPAGTNAMIQDHLIDFVPHRIWSLPPEVRRSLLDAPGPRKPPSTASP